MDGLTLLDAECQALLAEHDPSLVTYELEEQILATAIENLGDRLSRGERLQALRHFLVNKGLRGIGKMTLQNISGRTSKTAPE